MPLSDILAAVPPVSFMVDYFLSASIRETCGVLSGNMLGGERMRCVGNGFFAENLESSRMIGGSVVDVLAASLLRRGGSGMEAYKAAIESLISRYADRMPHGAGDPNVIMAAAAEALETRKAYTLALCTRVDTYNMDQATRSLLGHVPAPPSGCGSVLGRQQVKSLQAYLEKLDGKLKLADAPAVVLAWMADAATIACLDIYQQPPGSQKKTRTTVWVQPYTYGILGLPRVSPGTPVQIESSYKVFCRQHHTNSCMVMDNPKGTMVPYVPGEAVCAGDPDCGDSLKLVPLHTAGCKISIATATGGITTWAHKTIDNVLTMLREDGRVTDRSRTLLETIRSVPGVKGLLFSRLEEFSMFEVLQALRYYFRKSVLHGSKGKNLYIAPTGFVVETEKTNISDPVSNFTFTPLHSVRFSMNDMHFYGTLTIKGDSKIVSIPDSALDSVKKFLSSIRESCALLFDTTTQAPTLFDTKEAKIILDWLVRAYSQKPQYPGTNVLGWDGARKRYYGVDFVCNESGHTSTSVYLHPSIRYFEYFAATGLLSDTPENIVPGLHVLCLKCAAMLARSFYCRPACAILFRSSVATDTTLQTVFTMLGQKCSVKLNPNMRENGDITAFQGYPVLATGYNLAQSNSVTASVVLTGDFGADLESCSMEQAVAAGRYLKRICEELPAVLLQGAQVEFSESVSEAALLEEGTQLIKLLEVRPSTDMP